MNYKKRLDHAFTNAPILPITPKTKYAIFSDCHRGIGNNNDNFLKNANSYFAALQYYYQRGFTYIENGDGDELWENYTLKQIKEIHGDVFEQLIQFQEKGRLFMLYGNHDMIKKTLSYPFSDFLYYEGLILRPGISGKNPIIIADELSVTPGDLHIPAKDIRIIHGHQADLGNSVLWKLTRFLVRYLWTPLEYFGVLDPTNAARNNTKKEKLEKRYLSYARDSHCLLMTGHTHRPTLGDITSPYYNCGSCVHPKCITCIELCGFQINLVKWHSSSEKSEHFGNIYELCPPTYPVYIKREVLGSDLLY